LVFLDVAAIDIYILSLHDALPISLLPPVQFRAAGGRHRGRDRAVAVDEPQLPARGDRALPTSEHGARRAGAGAAHGADVRRALRSEEHTSELQSRENLVCRLLLEK